MHDDSTGADHLRCFRNSQERIFEHSPTDSLSLKSPVNRETANDDDGRRVRRIPTELARSAFVPHGTSSKAVVSHDKIALGNDIAPRGLPL